MTDRASINRMERGGLHGRDAAPRIRAGAAQQAAEVPHSWIHDQAPRLRAARQERDRRERVWAWLSVVTLIVCWDASLRLDERVSPPHRDALTYAEQVPHSDKRAVATCHTCWSALGRAALSGPRTSTSP